MQADFGLGSRSLREMIVMELVKILKPLMELEYQMHRLYMWYGDMFESDSGARVLFRQMAREELKHRESVQNQFHLVIEHQHEYEPVEADLDGIIQLTNLLKQQVDMRQAMTLCDSLKTAIQLEKTAAETHYRFLIAKANPVLLELIAVLAKADKEHLSRLEGFYRSLDRA